MAIAYCNLEFQAIRPDTPKSSYIFKIGITCIRAKLAKDDTL